MVCDGSSKLPLVVDTETALLAAPPGAEEEEDSSSSWEEVRIKQQQQQQQAGDDTTTLSSGDMCTTYTPPTDEARTDGGSAHASPKQQAGTGSSSLSLADRQRLQREAQLTFLRTQGLLKDGDDVRGGAGAESPRVRDGIASPLTRSPFLVVDKSPGGTLRTSGSSASDDRTDKDGPTDSSPASATTASSPTSSNGKANNKAKRDSFLSFPSLERRGSALSPRWGSNNTSRRSSVDNGAATTNASPTVRRFEYPMYPEVISSLSFQKSGNTNGTGINNGDDAMASALSAARKAGVAVAGGALVAAGAIVAVAPTPGGILLAGAGLGVLSTEFEGAKTVLDKGKSKLVDLIDRVEGDGDEDGDGDSGGDINEMSMKEKKVGGDGEEQKSQENGKEQEDNEATKSEKGDDGDPFSHPPDDQQVESESSTTSTSPESSTLTTTTTTQTARVAPASATVAANTPSSAELKAALRTRARKIGKSIRPLLTDDDAPRRAMDEVRASTNKAVGEMKSSTHRALGRMRSHLNEIVDTFAVPDEAGGLPGWTNPNSSSINGNVDANDDSNVSANDTNGSADGAATKTTTTTTTKSNAPSSRDSLHHEPKIDTSLSTDGKEGKDSGGEALQVKEDEESKASQEDEEETATTASVGDMTDSSAARRRNDADGRKSGGISDADTFRGAKYTRVFQ